MLTAKVARSATIVVVAAPTTDHPDVSIVVFIASIFETPFAISSFHSLCCLNTIVYSCSNHDDATVILTMKWNVECDKGS